MTLQDIAEIKTGYFTQTDTLGNAGYLQVKQFTDGGDRLYPPESNVYINNKSTRHLLQHGDVLFAAKGIHNFAAVYTSAWGPCVASSSFFIIRVTVPAVLPEFIRWFINTPRVLRRLKAEAKGSSMPSIAITALERLRLRVPPLPVQQNILTVHRLLLREQAVSLELEQLRVQLAADALFQLTNQ